MPSFNPNTTFLIIALSSTAVASAYAYYSLSSEHARLSRLITKNASSFSPYTSSSPLSTLADPTRAAASDSEIFVDSYSLAAPTSSLPDESAAKLLTLFLRVGMSGFRKTPQGHLIAFVRRGLKNHVYDFEEIRKMDFEEGQGVVGTYLVVKREERRVEGEKELAIAEFAFGEGKHVAAELIFKVVKGDRDTMIESTTVMWDPLTFKRGKLLMNNPFLRWAHEITAMSLLEKGLAALQKQKLA
ncbi:hypothetical protein BJ742DRAFT_844578 [Cladochytrium replicatum]|nr:hypothetical protein BJ742DRAFT_844578 [Cladochytrium replicatum]